MLSKPQVSDNMNLFVEVRGLPPIRPKNGRKSGAREVLLQAVKDPGL